MVAFLEVSGFTAAGAGTSRPLPITGCAAGSGWVASVLDGALVLSCTVSNRLACASLSLARSRAEGGSELEGMLKLITTYEDGHEW